MAPMGFHDSIYKKLTVKLDAKVFHVGFVSDFCASTQQASQVTIAPVLPIYEATVPVVRVGITFVHRVPMKRSHGWFFPWEGISPASTALIFWTWHIICNGKISEKRNLKHCLERNKVIPNT